MDTELWFKIFENKGTVTSYILLMILLSCMMFSKIETDRQNIRIKIAIIYILSYILVFFNVADIKAILIILFIITFVILEFVFIDDFKRKIMKKRKYFILDYIYQIIFEYKILYLVISLLLLSVFLQNVIKFILVKLFICNFAILKIPIIKNCYSLLLPTIPTLILLIIQNMSLLKNCYMIIMPLISILFLINGIIKIINNEFETKTFEEIFKDMEGLKPFAGFGRNAKLIDCCNILTFKEDRSFFYREESYNWLSISFIKYRLNRMYISCKKYHIKKENIITKQINKIITFIYFIGRISYISIKYFKKILIIFRDMIKKRKKITNYLRGYSTIEMQLIRTLAVKDGYTTHTYQRKIYEFVYSTIFFDSLKNYYRYHEYNNLYEFKYYIIYLYIMIAPIRINGKNYDNIRKLYNKEELNKITIEEFYIWTFGLSHGSIGPYLLESILLEAFNIDRKKLSNLICKFMEETEKEKIL